MTTVSKRSGRGARVRRSLLYFLPTLVNGLVSLAAIPVLITSVGADDWARIALGQAVGSVGMTVISYGWSISGPSLVGSARAEERPPFYARAAIGQLAIAVPTLLVVFVATSALTGGTDPVAVLAGFGSALTGLSAGWFFAGSDRPVPLLTVDTLPRVAGLLAGIGITAFTGLAIAFPLGHIAGDLFALVASWLLIVGAGKGRAAGALGPRVIWQTLRTQSSGVLASLAYSVFGNAPLPLVAVFLPQAMVPFAVIDKLQKLLLTATAPLRFLLLARMGTGLDEGFGDVRAVVKSGLIGTLGAAAITGPAAVIAGGVLLPIVSAGTVEPAWWVLALLSAGVIGGFAAGALPAVCLAPVARVGAASWANVFGCLALVGIMAAFPESAPLLGALSAVALATGLVVGLEIWAVVRRLGHMRPAD